MDREVGNDDDDDDDRERKREDDELREGVRRGNKH